jgi:predicted NBD/HSP70 family sugar kinase
LTLTRCPLCGYKSRTAGPCAICGRSKETGAFEKAFLSPQSAEEFLERANPVETKAHKSVARGAGDNAASDDENAVNVVIDVGGTGTRIGLAAHGDILAFRSEHIDSMQALTSAILRLTDGAKADRISVSVPGAVKAGRVTQCWNAPWLEGDPAEALAPLLNARSGKIRVVNDGEAHALALRKRPGVAFGAIHIALGTGVAFGVLDANGNVLRSLSDDNWEIGGFPLNTQPAMDVWEALGGAGFAEAENREDDESAERFGMALGHFAAQMSMVFRPRTVGLSGGVVRNRWGRIAPGFWRTFDDVLDRAGHILPKPEVVVLEDENAALLGLATMF